MNRKDRTYVVIQGEPDKVNLGPHSQTEWEFLDHTHPPFDGHQVTDPLNYAASTIDMEMIAQGARKRAEAYNEQGIAITTPYGQDVTTFGYDANHAEPYFVDLPNYWDSSGAKHMPRMLVRFKSIENFHAFWARARAEGRFDASWADSASALSGHPGPSATRTPPVGANAPGAAPDPAAAPSGTTPAK
jgi:hypothetical protein